VVDSMLARGCPCRFPRFRATVERDTREVGTPGYTTWEQQLLVKLFDAKVPRRDLQKVDEWRERGVCAICGAPFDRWAEELFRDAWIEWARITPVLPDLGPTSATALPHCWPFYSAGPESQRGGLHLVEINYPMLSPDDWLAWLAA
jgi:hypothetical protein